MSRPERVLGSFALSDWRLDGRLERAAGDWAQATLAAEDGRVPATPLGRYEFRRAAQLHAKRTLKALRAGRVAPERVTTVQAAGGLRDHDLAGLNALQAQVIHDFLLELAESLGAAAVMHSDPERVRQLLGA